MSWLERGFQRNTAGLLDSQTNPDTYQQMLSQYKRAAIADMVGSIGGSTPGYMNQTLGRIPGLLEQQQAQQRQAANQGVLDQYAQQGVLSPHQQALLANNPELMEHFFKERYTGRSLAPGSDFWMGGQVEHSVPNRPQAVGTDLVDPNTGRLIHRAPQNPGVNVNVGGEGPRYEIGSIPPGHRQVFDEQGRPTHQEVMPGTPPARELEREEQARQTQVWQQTQTAGALMRDAQNALQYLDAAPDSPLMRRAQKVIPGSPTARMDAALESVRSTVAINELMQLKQSGVGLGQVPQSQLQMLATLKGKLDDPYLPKDMLQVVLTDLIEGYQQVLSLMTPEDMATWSEMTRREVERAGAAGFGGPPRGPVGPAAPTAPSGQATHRWNPETQRVEPIQR